MMNENQTLTTQQYNEILREQLRELLTTYQNMTGRRSINKYSREYLEGEEYDCMYSDDADIFISAFEDEFVGHEGEVVSELEAELHQLKENRDNKLNPMSCFRVCLRYWKNGYWTDNYLLPNRL